MRVRHQAKSSETRLLAFVFALSFARRVAPEAGLTVIEPTAVV